MRYYIEALDKEGRQILGNLDGQAALGERRKPERCAAWQRLPNVPHRPTVAEWRLVDEGGRIHARHVLIRKER